MDWRAKPRNERERVLREQAEEESVRNDEDEKAAECNAVPFGGVVQLRHVSTGTFITRRKAMARIERECLKVELAEYGDDGSHWRIVPVYKYRESGQKVPFGDAVTLQTQGSGGCLRVGGVDEQSVQLHPSYVENVFEANVGQSPSRWIMLPYRTVQMQRDQAIRGGDVVFVNHQETSLLLNWDLSAPRDEDDWDSVDSAHAVSFAVSAQDVARVASATKGIPSHTHAIWKVEAQHVQWAGLPVDPRRLYRLLNVGSAAYLALEPGGDGKVSLSSDYMSPSCLWEFAPVDVDAGAQHVFLRHSSGRWLYNRGGVCVVEDKSDLNQHIALIRLARSDCHEVDWARVRRFQLLDLVSIWRGGSRGSDREFFKQKAEEGVEAVRQMLFFLSEDEATREGPPQAPPPGWDPTTVALGLLPSQAVQRLFRELGLIDATLQLLSIIVPWVAEGETSDPAELHTLATYSHLMLRAAVAGSLEAKQGMQPHVSTIVHHMSIVAPRSVKAVELLAELLTDNRVMIRSLTADDVAKFTSVYMKYRRPQDLQLLASLCVCQNSPIPFVQNQIVRQVLAHSDSLPSLTWSRSATGAELRVVAKNSAGVTETAVVATTDQRSAKSRLKSAATTVWLSRGAFSGGGEGGATTGEPTVAMRLQELADRTLHLLAACSLGRNTSAKGAVASAGWSSRETLTEIAGCSSVPFTLRRGALRLLISIHVDQEPLRRQPRVRYTRLWSKVSKDEDEIVNTFDACEDVLRCLCSCLEDGLAKLKECALNDKPRRDSVMLVEAATTCLGSVMDLGALELSNTNPGVGQTVTKVCDLLIDALERPGAAEVGSALCRVLGQLFDLRVEARLSGLFNAYDRCHENTGGKVVPVPQGDLEALKTQLFESVFISEKVAASQTEGFTRTLMNVIEAGDSSVQLRRRAFHLLFRHTSQPAHFIRETKKVTVLALGEAAVVHAQALEAAQELGKLLENVAADVTQDPKTGERVVPEASRDANLKVQHIMSDMCALLRRTDENGLDLPTTPACPRLGSKDMKGRIAKGMPAAIVSKYQDVLRNAGVHRSVLDILMLPIRRIKLSGGQDGASNEMQRDTFTECYTFLRLFCRENKDNQEIIFRQTPHFLRHVGVKGLNTADTVAESIRDNPGLAAQVDDKVLRTFIQAIVRFGKRARWLRLMESFVEANGRPVQRNQERVLNMILAEEGETVLEMDGDQEGAKEGDKTRYELMLDMEHETGMTSFLRYHVTCVRLLGRCSAGNRANAQKCSALLSLQKTLEHIRALSRVGGDPNGAVCSKLNPSAVRYVKSSFVLFMRYVHLDSKAAESFAAKNVRDLLWSGDGVMNGFAEDLDAFTALVKQRQEPGSEDASEELRGDQFIQYVVGALIPFLEKFFQSSRKDGCFVASGGDDPAVAKVVGRVVEVCADAASAVAESTVLSSEQNLKPVRDLLAQLTQKYIPSDTEAASASSPPRTRSADMAAVVVEGRVEGRGSGEAASPVSPSASPKVVAQAVELAGGVMSKLLDAVDKVESELEHKEFLAKQDTRTEAEVQADTFKANWVLYWKSFSNTLGVNPSQTVGLGLRKLVSVLSGETGVLECIAEMLRWQGEKEVAGEEPDRTLQISGLRALRAWLQLGAEASTCSPEEWSDFLSGTPPQRCTKELVERQLLAVDLGVIPTAIELAGNAEPMVSKEALMILVLLTHGKHASKGFEVQDAMREALSLPQYSAGSVSFIDTCRELIKQSIQSLKERKKILKRKKAERDAKLQAKRMRDTRSRNSGSQGDMLSETGSMSPRSEGSCASTVVQQMQDEEEAGAQVEWQDSGIIKEVLAVLANLCRGGHRELQRLLATTPGESRETLLDELSLYLTQLEPQISVSSRGNKELLRVMSLTYVAIREMVAGDRESIGALLETKALDTTCRIMQHLKHDGTLPELKRGVRGTIFTLLRSLLESLTAADRELAMRLSAKVDSVVFVNAWKELCEHHRTYKKEVVADPGEASHDTELDSFGAESSLAFLVLHGLSEMNPGVLERMKQDEESFKFCRKKMRVIEIETGGSLARLRFIVSAAAEDIASGARFRQSVQALQTKAVAADDDEEKHQVFQAGMVDLVRNEIKERRLKDKPGLGRLHERRDQIQVLPLVLTFLLNAILLLCEPLVFPNKPEATPAEGAAATEGAAAAAAGPPELLTDFGLGLLLILSLAHTVASCLRLVHCGAVHSTFGEEGEEGVSELWRHRIKVLFTGRVIIEVLYTVFSLCGLLWSPYFFTLHMFELMDTPPVRLLLDCVLSNYIKLAQAGAVIVLVVYIYSVLGFKMFPERHEDGKCQTLLNCFVSYLDGGLTGAGIHGVLTGFTAPTSLWEVDLMPWLLIFMQMSYFTVYVVVLLGVFSGIIIDSFGQLRDETSEVNERLRTRCFISGLEKSVIEQAGGEPLPFWCYVDFFLFTTTTDIDTMSDLEVQVTHKIRADEADWLPLRKCFAVSSGGQDEAQAQAVVFQEALSTQFQALEKLIVQQSQLLNARIGALEKVVAQPRGAALWGKKGAPSATQSQWGDDGPCKSPRTNITAGDTEAEANLRAKLAELRARIGMPGE
eukprot:Hpha_TRINITY_DN16247_c1_g3::TRINITY_DN16247_c1_g3_i2::g.15455::m.15455/K04958/ITPR1; inositol 1,4,5-triphosphate receptor type 1